MVEKIHSTPSFDEILEKEWFQYIQYSGTSQRGPSDKGTLY